MVSQNINHRLSRFWLVLGCLNAAIAVALGAAAAHALKSQLLAANTLQWFQTAHQYHQWHALGLLFVGLLALIRPKQRLIHVAGALMLLGMLLFSGLLYVRSLGGIVPWHGLIPFGGAALIASWLVLAVALCKHTDTG